MVETAFLFDVLLCLGLVGLAWSAVTSDGQFRGTIMFMVFGMLMAACWARLQAPDLALAEAAIGAGLTGALLLNACHAARTHRRKVPTLDGEKRISPTLRVLAALGCTLLAMVLAWLMLDLLGRHGPVAEELAGAQPHHFLGNPVTSVLLDYRAYDTLLEMVVLLLAVVGARTLVHQYPLPVLHPPYSQDPPMVTPLLRTVTPLILVTGLYLFWAGAHAPGGAFQAGALLAALGVMYRLTGRLRACADTSAPLRVLLGLGLGLFILFALAGHLWADAPLTYPGPWSYTLVLTMEFALTVSIATTLILLVSSSPGIRLERQT